MGTSFTNRLRGSSVLLALAFGAIEGLSLGGATAQETPAVTPSIARVTAWVRDVGAGGAETAGRRPAGQSFGFVVESNGLLVTTYQTLLAPGGEELLHDITAELLTDRKPEDPPSFPAEIVAIEPTLNLSILKIDAGRELTASVIADRKSIVDNQAIHAPTGVSGEDGEIPLASGTLTQLNSMECYQESMTATMYQAKIDLPDTAIGAPVFGDGGEIVALHTGYTPPPDDNHVIEPEHDQHLLPVFLVFNIYESLKLRKSLKSPWTGFSIRPLTEDEKTIFPTPQRFLGGVGIDHVWENSPAERMGIEVDDILVRFSYYPVTSPAEFQKWLYLHGVGHPVKLHLIRGGKEYRTVDYTIEARPAWAKPQ